MTISNSSAVLPMADPAARPQPEPSRITVVDINAPARSLAWLRASDYLLVVVCGFGLLGTVPELLRALADADVGTALGASALGAALGFAAYTGWKHVGVIDPRAWRAYLRVFPLLCGFALVSGLVVESSLRKEGWAVFRDADAVQSMWSALEFAAVAILGFVSVQLLRRARIASLGLGLSSLLERLGMRAGAPPRILGSVPSVQIGRGLAFGLAGVLILIGCEPAPDRSTLWSGFAFFLIVRARRYFQVDADTLLAVDRRAPVLFLRAFEDDERQKYSTSRRALLDFSLETRLANHFCRFGPFIAVGSPKETVPQPGAARAHLRDDEWQGRVLGWMQEANLIVMYCGKTEWVNWELRKVIESGRASRLILMFPEIVVPRAHSLVDEDTLRSRSIAMRVAQVRAAFKDTPWNEELAAFDDYDGLRAMLFRPNGSMLMVKSRSRSRDAYHLAALIAHQQMLAGDEAAASVSEPAPRTP